MNMNNNSIWGRMFKTSMLYTFGIVLAKFTTFLLLPLYTNRIPTEDYGTYDLVIAYSAIIVPLVGVNCWQGMLRFVIEEKDINNRHRIISQGWIMLILSGIVLSLGYGIICFYLSFSHKILIYCCFITQLFQYFYLYSSRGFNRNKVYAWSGVVSSLTVAAVTIICVFVFNMTLAALYISLAVSLIVQVVFMEYYLRLMKDISLGWVDWTKIREIYKYCAPEAVSNVFNWLLDSVNRVIIVAVLGLSANGIYAISHKFIGILTVFVSAFVLSFQESIYAVGRDELKKVVDEVLCKFTKYIGIFVSLLLLFTSIVYPIFVSGEYREGYMLIPLFYAKFLVSGITWLLSSTVSATKKTQLTLYEKMLIGTINFMLIMVLIRPLGLSSSPISLLTAECCGILVFKYLLSAKAGLSISIPIRYIVGDFILLAITSTLFLYNSIYFNAIGILLLLSSTAFINRKNIQLIYIKIKRKITI